MSRELSRTTARMGGEQRRGMADNNDKALRFAECFTSSHVAVTGDDFFRESFASVCVL